MQSIFTISQTKEDLRFKWGWQNKSRNAPISWKFFDQLLTDEVKFAMKRKLGKHLNQVG